MYNPKEDDSGSVERKERTREREPRIEVDIWGVNFYIYLEYSLASVRERREFAIKIDCI